MTPTNPASASPVLDDTRLFRAAGVAMIVSFRGAELPEVLHWGADPGPVSPDDLAALTASSRRQVSSSALDRPWALTVLPTERDGWQGRPGVAGIVDGRPFFPGWRVTGVDADEAGFVLNASDGPVELTSALRLDAEGILHATHTIRNAGADAVQLNALEATLPVPARASELFDFAGRWTRERTPQRRPMSMGSQVRETRRGRTGHDAPMLTVLGTPGFADRSGEVWGVHLAWSGDALYRTDRLAEGRSVLGAAELLRAGEIVLTEEESFTTPEAMFSWSADGLDGLSQRFHRSLRARAGHPRAPRPVVLNTWEAVYFDHDLAPLVALADVAAEVGVERFVLDDGWFLGRRSDDAGLGDWIVDPEVWPHGLHPLIAHVHARGMGFGLWVEPEMINPDSDLARVHPDWVLGPADHDPLTWRTQHLLDIARPEVAAYVLDRLDALLREYPIEALKWDQNRDLLEAVHAGRAGVDAHTRAVYALLDELRRRHPSVEIESCASGGARIDLGILGRTDRVWASDTNDPLERTAIQRWTEVLLPPELIGSHVGPARAHTTDRVTDLRFRMATALFAHAGIETDITRFTPQERAELAAWIGEYKRLRDLIHSGDLVHAEVGDAGAALTGVVSPDRGHALYRITRTATGDWAVPPALLLPGLDDAATYRVRVLADLSARRYLDAIPVPWIADGAVEIPGSLLRTVGMRMPLLAPASALVLEVERA